MSDSVAVLIESADRCMDREDAELCDWDHISTYLSSSWYLDCLAKAMQVSYIRNFAYSHLYEHLTMSYDILICYHEAHEETKRLMQNVLD